MNAAQSIGEKKDRVLPARRCYFSPTVEIRIKT